MEATKEAKYMGKHDHEKELQLTLETADNPLKMIRQCNGANSAVDRQMPPPVFYKK